MNAMTPLGAIGFALLALNWLAVKSLNTTQSGREARALLDEVLGAKRCRRVERLATAAPMLMAICVLLIAAGLLVQVAQV